MPDVLGGLLARQSPSMGNFVQRYLSGALSPSPRVKAAKALIKAKPAKEGLLGDIALAPVRAMTAQPEQSPGSRFPGLLGDLIDATDPVQAFGGYGSVAAMAVPVGAPKGAPGLLGRYQTTTPARVVNKTRASGGYTVHLPTGVVPEEGLMVGKYANENPRSLQVPSGLLGTEDVRKFVAKNRAQLEKETQHLGTWDDPETGKVYFDVSNRFSPFRIRQATKYGERTGQKSGWDIGKGESFDIRKWDDFIEGDVFHGRMAELAAEGAEYLKQFPTKDWWDTYGTAFEQVYGRENLPAVAGFTASTAPKTQPKRNVQVASEYMRRYIKGEDIIQPGWRAPRRGMLGGVVPPGQAVPMERSHGRYPNLLRVGRGEMPSGDKVSSQARAMMGDPTVGVYDQYWARIAEDPASGVYTGTQAGVIPRGTGPNRPYMRLDRQVEAAAAKSGDDVRRFSANVWTGIRNRVNETGEAYGQQYGTKGKLGESKALADHLSDLVARKARQLKISTGEMEARLRAGDASLLSFMLATPFLKSLFSDAESRPHP